MTDLISPSQFSTNDTAEQVIRLNWVSESTYNPWHTSARCPVVKRTLSVLLTFIFLFCSMPRASAESDLTERGRGYGMPTQSIDGNDLDVVIEEFAKAGEMPGLTAEEVKQVDQLFDSNYGLPVDTSKEKVGVTS